MPRPHRNFRSWQATHWLPGEFVRASSPIASQGATVVSVTCALVSVDGHPWHCIDGAREMPLGVLAKLFIASISTRLRDGLSPVGSLQWDAPLFVSSLANFEQGSRGCVLECSVRVVLDLHGAASMAKTFSTESLTARQQLQGQRDGP